jgi:hypothetical protein
MAAAVPLAIGEGAVLAAEGVEVGAKGLWNGLKGLFKVGQLTAKGVEKAGELALKGAEETGEVALKAAHLAEEGAEKAAHLASQAGKEAAHLTEEGAEKAAHLASQAGKEAAHLTEEAGEEVAHLASQAGKEAAHLTEEAGEEVAHLASEVESAASSATQNASSGQSADTKAQPPPPPPQAQPTDQNQQLPPDSNTNQQQSPQAQPTDQNQQPPPDQNANQQQAPPLDPSQQPPQATPPQPPVETEQQRKESADAEEDAEALLNSNIDGTQRGGKKNKYKKRRGGATMDPSQKIINNTINDIKTIEIGDIANTSFEMNQPTYVSDFTNTIVKELTIQELDQIGNDITQMDYNSKLKFKTFLRQKFDKIKSNIFKYRNNKSKVPLGLGQQSLDQNNPIVVENNKNKLIRKIYDEVIKRLNKNLDYITNLSKQVDKALKTNNQIAFNGTLPPNVDAHNSDLDKCIMMIKDLNIINKNNANNPIDGSNIDTLKKQYESEPAKLECIEKFNPNKPGNEYNTNYLQNMVASNEITTRLEKNEGVNKIFNTIYKFLCYLCILAIFSLFLLALFDVLTMLSRNISQYFDVMKNPMYTKDTVDFETLQYVGTNNIDNEPYNIYMGQAIIGGTYAILAIMVTLIAIQCGIMVSQALYSMFIKGKKVDMSIEINEIYLKIFLVTLVACLIIGRVYKNTFIKKTQPALKNIRTQVRDVRSFIYENLTKDSAFLSALVSDDIGQIVTIIRNTLSVDNPADCTNFGAECTSDIEVSKMIFTYSLYSYFKQIIPESDMNFNTVMSIFKLENVLSRLVDPVQFLYYKRSLSVNKLYAIMRDNIVGPSQNQAFLHINPSNGAAEFSLKREEVFKKNYNKTMDDLNDKLSALYNLPESKTKLYSYLSTYLFFTTIFLIIICIVCWNELNFKSIILNLWAFIKRFLHIGNSETK